MRAKKDIGWFTMTTKEKLWIKFVVTLAVFRIFSQRKPKEDINVAYYILRMIELKIHCYSTEHL